MRYSSQRMLLYACIVILVLVAMLLFFVVRAFWTKNRLNAELSDQKKRLEEQRDQLISLSKQLEEATHAKLAFFTNVSHDFRTPNRSNTVTFFCMIFNRKRSFSPNLLLSAS